MIMRTYKIGEVAKLAGISIRTLRYYDTIDLLKPSKMLANGHRSYNSDDVKKLQVVLGLKVLGFSLQDIRKYIQNPDVNLIDVLKYQQKAIAAKLESLQEIDKKLAHILSRHSKNETIMEKDVFAVYEMLQMSDHNDVLLQYFTPEEVQNTMRAVNDDAHASLYEAVKLLGLTADLSEKNTAFVADTFAQFIRLYFVNINEQTITKTIKMLVEMLQNDPTITQGAFSETRMKAWLLDHLLKKEA